MDNKFTIREFKSDATFSAYGKVAKAHKQGQGVLMTKQLINQDAAYALGEEAFRAGFQAGWEAKASERIYPMSHEEQAAWDEFEPSEAVKELIG